ncbi:MAG TPA: hypothetical protein VHV83_18400 [Armatimonadota bacterium]|nr:hypothetical protein [Armatimonadota bacterium]
MKRFAIRCLLVSGAVLLFTLAAICQDTKPFTFTDPFTNYAAGSDGSPNWKADAGSTAWKVKDGALRGSATARQFIDVTKAPTGKTVHLQATITVRSGDTPAWNVTGIAVRQNVDNYWHLALVEAPPNENKRHFVELCEMKDKKWQAQFTAETKLASNEWKDVDFAWEYNHPYKLTLDMSTTGIRGQITELDGTVRSSIAYNFNAPAVTQGLPSLTISGMTTDYDDVAVSVADIVPATAPAK